MSWLTTPTLAWEQEFPYGNFFNQKHPVPSFHILYQGVTYLTINVPLNPVLQLWVGRTCRHIDYSKQVSPPSEAGRVIPAFWATHGLHAKGMKKGHRADKTAVFYLPKIPGPVVDAVRRPNIDVAGVVEHIFILLCLIGHVDNIIWRKNPKPSDIRWFAHPIWNFPWKANWGSQESAIFTPRDDHAAFPFFFFFFLLLWWKNFL